MLIVVPIALLVASIAGGFSLWSATERLIASAHTRHLALGYATESAAERVIAGLAQEADWTDVPSTWAAGMVVSSSDLDARSAALNADMAARFPLGSTTPRWRLVWTSASPLSAVWIADDVVDGDDDATIDSNGVLAVRAEAWAASGSRRALEMLIVRGAGGVDRRAWREVTW